MKRKLVLLLALLLPVIISASEGAGGESHGGHGGWFSPIWGVPAVVWQFVNLALVAALFYYLLRVRLPNAFRQKTIEIENALDKAKKEKEDSLAKLKELEEKMASLETEVRKIESEARESAEREKARLTRSAQESAEWLKKEAEEEFARRERDAERRLKAITVEAALKIAGDRVRGTISAEDEARLLERFSGELKDRLDG